MKIRLYLWWEKVLLPCLLVDCIYNFGEIYMAFPDNVKDKTCWFIWVPKKVLTENGWIPGRIAFAATWAWNVKLLLADIVPVIISLSAFLAIKDKKFEERKERYQNIFRLFFTYGILELFYYFANHKTDYYQTIYIIVFLLQWYWKRKELKIIK